MTEALVLHIPHASLTIPAEERHRYLPNDARLTAELLRMTDAWTDNLVDDLELPATRIVFPVSRLVMDVERFPDDQDEPMAARGMGAMYTRLSSGEPLRNPDPDHREALMKRWYWPHHARLTEAVDQALEAHGHCLIVDVHSFPSSPLPHEADQDPDRPEICLGTDTLHSPYDDDQIALEVCRRLRFTVALNKPFSGSIVPSKHWGRTKAVRSLMIEVRRDLYMSEETGERGAGFDVMAARVCQLVAELVGARSVN